MWNLQLRIPDEGEEPNINANEGSEHEVTDEGSYVTYQNSAHETVERESHYSYQSSLYDTIEMESIFEVLVEELQFDNQTSTEMIEEEQFQLQEEPEGADM